MPLAGKAVMINWSDVALADRHAYYEWHNREHMQGTIALPGAQRVRRFIAVNADRDLYTCCEVDDLGVVTGEAYNAKVARSSPLTRATTKLIKNAIRGLAHVKVSLGPGLGGSVLTLRLDAEAGHETELGDYLATALSRAVVMPEVVGGHYFVSDMPASSYMSTERQGRPTAVPPWAVMLEGVHLEAVEAACNALFSDAVLLQHGAKGPIVRGTYLNEITVAKMPNWQP